MTRQLTLVVLLGLAAIAVACGGSSSPDGGGGDIGNAPAGLSLIIFRDTLNNTIVAHSITDGRRWQRPTSSAEVLTAVDCSRDGERAAYLVKRLPTGSEVRISGGQSSPVPIPGEAFGIAWAPDGSRIAVTAFTPATSGNRLDLLDPGSAELTTAIKSSGPIGSPRWSPDGTKIVFDATNRSSNQIFVYTLGESAATTLGDRLSPAFAPDWSPDSGALIFSAPAANLSQLFTIGADGDNERQLTSSQISKGFPRFSPDGSTVAFAGTIFIPGLASRPVALHNLAVYTMKADGTGEQPITDLVQDAWLLGWCVSGPWLNDGWTAQ